ncbi:MAG TPA: hypothetical protein VNO30_03445 [Kofleriaceae bacterium]|nr:hypothetical protein [Kofleriaceae bacterium]
MNVRTGTAPGTAATTAHQARASLHSLDTLAERTHEELDALYRAAAVSASMRAVDGPLVGRMLTVRGVPSALARPLRRWAAAPSFVWEGKTFQAASDAQGTGHNRVNVPGVLGRQSLFPFATSFGPSALDGAPTLILDYDLDVNPGFIRRIHDEIREVSPGVFLGPAMWKTGRGGAGDKVMVLWFALDGRLS